MDLSLKNKTAVLLFANSGQEDERLKSFWNSADLFDDLNQRTLRMIGKTGIPFFHYTEHEQKGYQFGERFARAIQEVFDRGYQYIITVGNDSPQLSSSDIQNTLSLLTDHKLVIGPSTDGGFYLMGMQRELFDYRAFMNLPWQTAGIRHALINLLDPQRVNTALLRAMTDLDEPSDVGLLLSRTFIIPVSIINYLRLCCSRIKPGVVRKSGNREQFFTSAYFNKGSPSLFHPV